ncbi:hypothetical protein JCM18237_24440 [Halorubrum luteum]
MTDDNLTRSTFDHGTVRSASRLILTALSLVVLLYLLTVLPGIDRVIPNTPVTIAALVTAIVTVVVAGLLIYAAPKLATLARLAVEGSWSSSAAGRDAKRDPVAENAAGIVYWLVALAAVVVTHRGLAGAVTPLLDGAVWVYDAAFLLVSLVPLVFAVARLAAAVDPLSTRIADRVAGPPDGE